MVESLVNVKFSSTFTWILSPKRITENFVKILVLSTLQNWVIGSSVNLYPLEVLYAIDGFSFASLTNWKKKWTKYVFIDNPISNWLFYFVFKEPTKVNNIDCRGIVRSFKKVLNRYQNTCNMKWCHPVVYPDRF